MNHVTTGHLRTQVDTWAIQGNFGAIERSNVEAYPKTVQPRLLLLLVKSLVPLTIRF